MGAWDAHGNGIWRPNGESQAPGMGLCDPWNGRRKPIHLQGESF